MNEALRHVLRRLAPRSAEDRRRRFAATVLLSASAAGGIPLVAALHSDAVSDVRGAPGSVWLSGEQSKQVVLAATGGELASLALPLAGFGGNGYDVVDTGSLVLAQDRASGSVAWIDGLAGKVGTNTFDAPAPSTDAAALVAAGPDAYVVDPTTERAQRFHAESPGAKPTLGPSIKLGPFTQWVGTNDGRLWALDVPSGDLVSLDGDRVTHFDFSEGGHDLSLSAVGADPVVLDRTSGRLRWPRAANSSGLTNFAGQAVLQYPSPGGECAVVVLPDAARCIRSDGTEKSLPADFGAASLESAQVFANGENIVVAWSSSTNVKLGSWPDGTWTDRTRSSASARVLVGHWSPGGLMVDDPGDKYAFTANRGKLTELDKFDERTVVLSADGLATAAGVAGAAGSDGAVVVPVGDLASEEASAATQGDDRGPDPKDDVAVTRVHRQRQIDVLANDAVDPSRLAVKSVVVDDGEGTADVLDGTAVLFTPTGQYPGEAHLTYEVSDSQGRTGTAHVTVSIIGSEQNTPPKANPDAVTVQSGVDKQIDVTANDTDAEGDPLTVTKVVKPSHGTATVDDSGKVGYKSDPGFVGEDTFTYEVKDGYREGVAEGTVTVTVTPASATNSAPVPKTDRTTVIAGATVQVDVLTNDTDPDGDSLRVRSATAPEGSGLTAIVLPDQQVSITAAANATPGLVQVPYEVWDTATPPAKASSTIAVVVVSSTPENRPPIAVDDLAVVTQGSPKIINVTANDSDPDHDPITVVGVHAVTPSTAGTARVASSGSIEFTATPGLPPESATFDYTLSDNHGLSSTARVTVQIVASSNSGPVARDDIVTVFGADPVSIPVLANDSHPDGLPIALSGTPSYSTGTVSVDASAGVITFTPPSAEPHTYTFTYRISDPNGRTATAQVVVTVDKAPTKNQAPVAVNDQASTASGVPVTINVLGNDVDPDGQQLSVQDFTQPSPSIAGSVARASAGSDQLKFTPNPGYYGLASFGYTAADPANLTATATVVVNVAAPAKVAPVARDDLAALLTGQTAPSVDVLANDTDADGPVSALTITGLTPPTGGPTGVIVGGKTLRITAGSTPGTYQFVYTISDGELSSSAKLTVVVSAPPNQPPSATTDLASTPNNTPVTIPVLANDTDPDGGVLALADFTQPLDEAGNAAGSTRATGSQITYSPPGTSFAGTATFNYTVRDVGGLTDRGTVKVTVSPCSDVIPSLSNDIAAGGRGALINIPILANDAAYPADPVLGDVSPGSATLQGGVVGYRAPAAAGAYGFTYSVTNRCGNKQTASVSVIVNRKPVAVADSAQAVAGGSPITIPVLANDTDPDGDDLSIVASSITSANASVSGDGRSIVFSPSANAGTVSFSYTIVDCTTPGCGPASATATVTVVMPNRAPIAVADTYTIPQGQSSLLDVTKNDIEPDGDPLILTSGWDKLNPVSALKQPLTLEGNQVRFSPGDCYTGVVTFTYWVTDGKFNGATGSVTVNITPAANTAPTTGNDSFSTAQDTPLPIGVAALLANDSDPNPCDQLVVTSVTNGANGTATLAGATVTYSPEAGFSGSDSFTYTVSDGHGGTATATVSITVSPSPTTTTTAPPTTPPPTTAPPAATAAPTTLPPASSP